MPKRINKAIELLEAGQPVYATGAPEVSYEAGKAMAQTWADMIRVGMEHGPFDMTALRSFMLGLRDGGPTPGGHLTPTVVVELPVEGTSKIEEGVRICGVSGASSEAIARIGRAHTRRTMPVQAEQ